METLRIHGAQRLVHFMQCDLFLILFLNMCLVFKKTVFVHYYCEFVFLCCQMFIGLFCLFV